MNQIRIKVCEYIFILSLVVGVLPVRKLSAFGFVYVFVTLFQISVTYSNFLFIGFIPMKPYEETNTSTYCFVQEIVFITVYPTQRAEAGEQ